MELSLKFPPHSFKMALDFHPTSCPLGTCPTKQIQTLHLDMLLFGRDEDTLNLIPDCMRPVKIEWGGRNYLSTCKSAWGDWKETFKQKVGSALVRPVRLCLLFGEWHVCWCFPASSPCVCLLWLLGAGSRQDQGGSRSLSRLSFPVNKLSLAKLQGCSWAPQQWEGWTRWRNSGREMLLLEMINSLQRTHTSVTTLTTVRYFYDQKEENILDSLDF